MLTEGQVNQAGSEGRSGERIAEGPGPVAGAVSAGPFLQEKGREPFSAGWLGDGDPLPLGELPLNGTLVHAKAWVAEHGASDGYLVSRSSGGGWRFFEVASDGKVYSANPSWVLPSARAREARYDSERKARKAARVALGKARARRRRVRELHAAIRVVRDMVAEDGTMIEAVSVLRDLEVRLEAFGKKGSG